MNPLRGPMISALILAAAAAPAQDPPPIEITLSLEAASKYVWRGTVVSNASVLQPSVSFASRGFTLGFWGNLELTGWNDLNYEQSARGRFSEIDVTLEYGQDWDRGSWWVGYADYQYPNTGFERWGEFYAGVSFADLPGSPSLTVLHGRLSGTSAIFGFAHSFECKTHALDAVLEIAWSDAKANDYFYGHRTSGFTDAHASIGSTFELGPGWTFTPSLHASTLLNKRLLEGEPRRTNFWVSLGFSYSF